MLSLNQLCARPNYLLSFFIAALARCWSITPLPPGFFLFSSMSIKDWLMAEKWFKVNVQNLWTDSWFLNFSLVSHVHQWIFRPSFNSAHQSIQIYYILKRVESFHFEYNTHLISQEHKNFNETNVLIHCHMNLYIVGKGNIHVKRKYPKCTCVWLILLIFAKQLMIILLEKDWAGTYFFHFHTDIIF